MDGTRGDHVIMARPYVVDAATVDDIVDRLDAAVDEVMEAL